MLRTETRTIGDLDVTTTQFSALRSLRLMTKLGSIVAPLLAKLDSIRLDTKLTDIAPVVSEVFAHLSPDEAIALVQEVLASTYVVKSGEKIELAGGAKIDLVFNGNLAGLLKTVVFAIEVNFKDFFSGLNGGTTPS